MGAAGIMLWGGRNHGGGWGARSEIRGRRSGDLITEDTKGSSWGESFYPQMDADERRWRGLWGMNIEWGFGAM